MTKDPENKEELIITRIFDAPRELVWKAWTEPEPFMRWWGPKGFSAPVTRIDFRVGGKYLNCMRSPEGRDFWSTGVYREIVPMERIVCTDSFADEKGGIVPASHYGMTGEWPLEMLVSVIFGEQKGKTKLTLRHSGISDISAADRANMEQGWNESFDKLAESLEQEKKMVEHTRLTAEPGKQEIVLTRVFDAPREAVFKASTDPDLISQWWGPRRFTVTVDKMEVKQGGIWRFVNRDAAGNEYGFHGVHHEILAPERIVRTFEFEGMPGHVSLETATFEEENGRTKLTVKSVFQSVEDRDGMLRSGMEEGASETQDRLAELLIKLQMRKAA